VAPTEGQGLLANYRSTGLTLGRHPVALLREKLRGMRPMPVEVLMR
jgi:error-prone DNA polymerase